MFFFEPFPEFVLWICQIVQKIFFFTFWTSYVFSSFITNSYTSPECLQFFQMSGYFHVCLGIEVFLSKCLAFPENLRPIRIVSRQTERYWTVRNAYRHPIFWIVWKNFRLSGKFTDCVDTFAMWWKLSGLSGNLLEFVGSFFCLDTF